MSEKDDMRRTLEEVTALKSEYFIGSRNAFYYLKVRKRLEKLRDLIIKENPELQEVLSIRTLSWILEISRVLLELYLNRLACKLSTPANLSCLSAHTLDSLVLGLDPADFTGAQSLESIGVYRWTCDALPVKSFLCEWDYDLKIFCQISQFANVFLDFLDVVWEKDCLDLWSVDYTRMFKPSDLVADSRYHCNNTIRDLWHHCEWLLKDEKLDENVRSNLASAIEREDEDEAHSIILNRKLENLTFDIQRKLRCMGSLEEADDLVRADDWLYDPGLYKRFGAEYALGRIEVERRLCINVARGYQEEIWNGRALFRKEPAVYVLLLLDKLKSRVQKCREEIEDLLAHNAPKNVLKDGKALLKRHRYQHLAVLQNKDWLIKFISR